MSHHRLAVLADARSRWPADLHAPRPPLDHGDDGTRQIEVITCTSAAQLRGHLHSGPPLSAVLLDARHPAVDRDLIALLRAASITVVVSDEHPDHSRWRRLGADAVLPHRFDVPELLSAIAGATTTPAVGELPGHEDAADRVEQVEVDHVRGRLVAVLGRSGSGASSIAIGVAQALGAGVEVGRAPVVLADLALHAHQAVLHGAVDMSGGLPDLLDTSRTRAPSPEQVTALTIDVAERGYRLLLGLRNHHDWIGVGRQSLRAALDGIQEVAAVVVADIDSDLEGEDDTGSLDIEDRNLMARTVVSQADVVVAVGTATAKGLYDLATLLRDLAGQRVALDRVMVVVNRAPRLRRPRAAIATVIADLSPPGRSFGSGQTVFVPRRPRLDDVHRRGRPMPAAVTRPLGSAIGRMLHHLPPLERPVATDQPVRVNPGEVGHLDR